MLVASLSAMRGDRVKSEVFIVVAQQERARLFTYLRVDFSGRQLENDLVGCVDFGWRQHGDDDDDRVDRRGSLSNIP